MNNLTPKFNNGIPVVFATDGKFIPYLYVAIQSLVDNSSKDNNYDIVILYSNIEEYKRNQFKELERENISVRFYDMTELMDLYKDVWYTHWHYTEAMYYRFFIPQLFADYKKVVYLDCDIIVNCDIAELYNTDMEGKAICAQAGAIREPLIDWDREYIEGTLKISILKYFNSGVLVFDLQKISNVDFLNKCIEYLTLLKDPPLPDQDVLNLFFKDNIKYLDFAFNFSWRAVHFDKKMEDLLKDEERDNYLDTLKNPQIIHYAGKYKPWKSPELSYADYFWKYARKTPFYEEIIYRHSPSGLGRNAIYNAVYRRRIYLKYLKCKILKNVTFGDKKKHYISKEAFLRRMVKDYRKTLKK